MPENRNNKKALFYLLSCLLALQGHCLAAETGYFIPPSRSHGSAAELGKRSLLTQAPLLPNGTGLDLSIAAKAPPKTFFAPSMQSVLRRYGPISVEQNQSSPIAMEHGITTTFALPVAGIPGLDLTANFFAGHRDTRLGAPPGSAAVTGGIRWRW
ncbi:hypothetical protein [Asaia spathodeae]|uniref:hypothetical protein n=1 Tax=Asaia spathodeae TaxID=657016 RepID=UPI002FC27AC0